MKADENIRRLRFEVGMVLGGKTNSSANEDLFISPAVAKLMGNLRNPPPQSLRRDRFCVICGYFIGVDLLLIPTTSLPVIRSRIQRPWRRAVYTALRTRRVADVPCIHLELVCSGIECSAL